MNGFNLCLLTRSGPNALAGSDFILLFSKISSSITGRLRNFIKILNERVTLSKSLSLHLKLVETT